MARTAIALVVSVLLMGAGFSAGVASAERVCQPALRAELVAMMAQDQYEQSPDYGPWHGPQRTDRLREIIARYLDSFPDGSCADGTPAAA